MYVPVDARSVAETVGGHWAPSQGMAVTAMLRDMSADGDEELLAEQVRDIAALASVVDGGSPLRAVAAVDYARADVEAIPGHVTDVTLSGTVTRDMVACVFLDEEEARDDAAAAASGDAEALDRLESRELLWFDVSEIPSLAVV